MGGERAMKTLRNIMTVNIKIAADSKKDYEIYSLHLCFTNA
jgi:hypothetical protein